MNIHEHQAKQLLKKFGAIVPNGEACFTVQEVLEKAKKLNLKKYVLKAQIHAGGRGKAGGVKILDNLADLEKAANDLLGKKLVTHQTGPSGKEVKRLYLEELSNIEKEISSCKDDFALASPIYDDLIDFKGNSKKAGKKTGKDKKKGKATLISLLGHRNAIKYCNRIIFGINANFKTNKS